MINKPLLSLALVILVEAISAVVEYLKSKLMEHIHGGNDYGHQYA